MTQIKKFPRGGKKITNKQFSSNVFKQKGQKGRSKAKKKVDNNKKSPRNNDRDNNEEKTTERLVTSADALSVLTIREGMLILGRVNKIMDFEMTVSLPGRILGHLSVNDISTTYTNLIKSAVERNDDSGDNKEAELTLYKPLAELFKVGNYVVCYVKQINFENKWSVTLSLDPKFVNQNVIGEHLKKGSLVACSVASVEDHGFVMDTGIKTLRAFLKTTDADSETKYFPGKQVLCMIKSLEGSGDTGVLRLSCKSKHISNAKKSNDVPLDMICPGTKLDLRVEKVLSNGLRVSFKDDCVGIVNHTHLPTLLSNYEEGKCVVGTLLYVLPTTKVTCFSLLSDESEQTLKIGEIVKKAKFVSRVNNGVLLKLSQGTRGFVNFKHTGMAIEKIPQVFKEGSSHKCKIASYNYMDRLYICTMERESLAEKNIAPEKLKVGDVHRVTVTNVYKESGAIIVSFGDKLFGRVPPEDVDGEKPKVGDVVTAQVLSIEEEHNNRITCTLKKDLIEGVLPRLESSSEAVHGAKYLATVVSINEKGVLLRFYGAVKVGIPTKALRLEKPIDQVFHIGQIVTAMAELNVKKPGSLRLKIIDQAEVMLEIGEKVDGVVVDASSEGVKLRITKGDGKIDGFLPTGHMSPCEEIAALLSCRLAIGDPLDASVFATKPRLLLSRTLEPCKPPERLSKNDTILCSVSEIGADGLEVILPLEKLPPLAKVSTENCSNVSLIGQHQILFAKVLEFNRKKLVCSTSLLDVWAEAATDKLDTVTSVDLLNLYLNKVTELSEQPYYENHVLSKIALGHAVEGTVYNVTEHGLILKLDNGMHGIVRKGQYRECDVKEDYKLKGKVIWINYVHELLEITLLPALVDTIKEEQTTLPDIAIENPLRGEIVMVNNWFILVCLKGEALGNLAAIPVRRHLNDLRPDLEPYKLGSKIRCYVQLKGQDADLLPICILKSAFERVKASLRSRYLLTYKSKKPKSVKKRKSTSSNEATARRRKKVKTEVKEEPMDSSEATEQKIKFADDSEDSTSSDEEEQQIVLGEKKKVAAAPLAIEDRGFCWDERRDDKATTATVASSSDSSDDDDEANQAEADKKKRKKKLSAAERREEERKKEREIWEREQALASNQAPSSVDQFERLVLSNPDNSLNWIQYMTFHLQAIELDKARAVARRAIKTINFREEAEKLNVWKAWLNLEVTYGSQDVVDQVLQEALRTNDDLAIYRHMLEINADSSKQVELEKIVSTVTGRFKQNRDIWIDCGAAFYKIGMHERARRLMQRALQLLPETQHVDVLVKFALMENNGIDKVRSQTLFEQILTSYPKRVDVWTTYVDSLVKGGDIDMARKVLERAAVQSLPAKKMKTLFKKYINFEEAHGTEENVAHVRQMAVDYVEKQTNNSRSTT